MMASPSAACSFVLFARTNSIADHGFSWPTWEQWVRVLWMEDYNTRVVVIGTTLLGMAAGIVGSFTLLRKRALMGDAVSHAALPGVALAFIVATGLGWREKSLPILLVGATLSGLAGVAAILVMRRLTRLKEDTALGIVLSVFFGSGTALLGVIQQMKGGHPAGLESFIFGKTASMGLDDARLIAIVAILAAAVCLVLLKELRLLCFDDGFAGSRGYPVMLLDLILMTAVVAVSIVGLQAVGLILMVALLIIPPAASRFWTDSLTRMLWIAAALGAIGCYLGATVSALLPRIPSGAMIVLVCSALFLISMFFGSARGVTVRLLRRWKLDRNVDRQHLLRAMYEESEKEPSSDTAIAIERLLRKRSWSRRQLVSAIKRAEWEGLIFRLGQAVQFTKKGSVEAVRLTREHRLWEIFLIAHADVAPSRVDRHADRIEHVLGPEIISELEALLERKTHLVPDSPHDEDESHGLVPASSSVATPRESGV